ncbi:hypothetical protein [Ureaplasma urealyticum]|uniref:Uncharacterized protein n=2 Tax=Ureaplasma urealyticum TaxID=2130 RepID=A0AAP9AD00_UREUR|nr:hypothetical protein [Ureaplasma urealyticum]EDT49282.1 conserved hypothetical protein [Ureaplasma urealyticum serovar 13 str. ATCC 33698]EDU05970.1 conserved hypothetical protein [Ureaplasma urealyticum serovar 5 str. ATCC 27817]EDU56967.1 conserved hypothetical protein [Ureaplasma urealyticum serovar 7 str. ATCC 27819]EDU66962.1 conserved hypothetical protein [Ureaplasma urealyticum serovar 11 str. ATCC 33695]EEH01510.1 conserved hypothetical protein [Ureaplasma urealyticum serovar 8 str.
MEKTIIQLEFNEEELASIKKIKEKMDPNNNLELNVFLKDLIKDLARDYLNFSNQSFENIAKQMNDLKDLIGNMANDPSSFDFSSMMNEFQKYNKSQKDDEQEQTTKSDKENKSTIKPTKKS